MAAAALAPPVADAKQDSPREGRGGSTADEAAIPNKALRGETWEKVVAGIRSEPVTRKLLFQMWIIIVARDSWFISKESTSVP